MKLIIDLSGTKSAEKSKIWIITNENPPTHNSLGEEPNVAIQQSKSFEITCTLSFKPLGIILYRVPENDARQSLTNQNTASIKDWLGYIED